MCCLAFIFLTTYSFSQKLKVKTTYFPNSKQISKTYTVLKKDKKIKHGEFISYYKNPKKIKEKGRYINDKKEGEWIEHKTPHKKEIGTYENGKRIGIWNSYYKKRKVSSYSYTLNKKVGLELKFMENDKVIKVYDYDNDKEVMRTLENYARLYEKYASNCKEEFIKDEIRFKL